MTKEEVIDYIIERYKEHKNNGVTWSISLYNCCQGIDCDDCPFDGCDCDEDIAMSLLDRLVKAEESQRTETNIEVMIMNNLKPCPFCGNKVELEVKSYGYGKDYYEHCIVIRCDSCDFEFPKKPIKIGASWDASEFTYVNDMTEFNKAVELWNKRADMRGENK